MLVVNRFRVAAEDAAAFRASAQEFHALVAGCAGYVSGTLGRNVDDPDLWALATTWRDVGSYRRALSLHRVAAMALMTRMVDEPGAYEAVEPGVTLNEPGTRG